jgi:hypothetical protein
LWGWTIEPLGLPDLINGEWWLAGSVPINEGMLASTQAYFKIDGPQMIRRGITDRARRLAVA